MDALTGCFSDAMDTQPCATLADNSCSGVADAVNTEARLTVANHLADNRGFGPCEAVDAEAGCAVGHDGGIGLSDAVHMRLRGVASLPYALHLAVRVHGTQVSGISQQ